MTSGEQSYPWARLSRLAGVVLLILAIPAIPLAWRVKVDNRLEIFLNPDSEAGKLYDQFRETFGSDEFVIVAYSGKDLFDQEALDRQLDVFEALEKVPYVKRVSGLPQVYYEVFGAEDTEELKNDFLSTPFYKGFLISDDGLVAGLLLETEQPEETEGRRELVNAIYQAIQPLREYGFTVHVVGPPALHVTIEDVSRQETWRTFPPALACSILVLLFLFRSVRATIVALVCTSLTIVFLIAVMVLFRKPLNMVTSVLPVMLWVLALANLIHIIRRYQEYREEMPSSEAALGRALRETALPCALAIFTTAMGFLSLLVAALMPIRQLGVFAAIGLVISLAVNLTVGPMLVGWFRTPGLKRRSGKAERWANRICMFAHRYAWLVLAATAAVIVGTLAGLKQVRVESNSLAFLPDDSETVQSYDFVSNRLTGLYSLEVVINAPSGWLDDRNWASFEKVAADLQAEPGVARVVSPIDLLRKLNQWDNDFDPAFYRLPEDGATAQRLVGQLDEVGQDELTRLVGNDGKTIRLSVLIRDTDSIRFLEVARHAEQALAELPKPLGGYATGIVLQMADAQLTLIETQVRSFGLAFCSIFLCILIGLRSWRMTLVSFLPNIMPILATFGVMALFRVTLNPATVMVASVALGIAVDNAIHMLNCYQRTRREGAHAIRAVQAAVAKVGPAIAITTVTACIGFFALARSAFIPIRYVGILAGIAMLVALMANIFLVPTILTLRSGRAEADAPD